MWTSPKRRYRTFYKSEFFLNLMVPPGTQVLPNNHFWQLGVEVVPFTLDASIQWKWYDDTIPLTSYAPAGGRNNIFYNHSTRGSTGPVEHDVAKVAVDARHIDKGCHRPKESDQVPNAMAEELDYCCLLQRASCSGPFRGFCKVRPTSFQPNQF